MSPTRSHAGVPLTSGGLAIRLADPDDLSDIAEADRGMSRSARLHADGLTRCPWPGEDPFYMAYHDTEWGVPEYDDRALYEKLILDGFQAGLSWITILRKRDNFRRAFDDFEPDKIARYNAKKLHALMNDAGIVRNRAKIEGAVASAKSYLKIMEDGPGFSKFLWDFVDGRPKVNHFKTTASVPASTPLSIKMSKELASRGFKFVGPTIVYAFMQATGMVNDHLVTCFCHESCAGKHRAPRPQSQMTAEKPFAPQTSTRVWQRMLSGRRLDLLDPSPLDIEIADIAHGLARVARWNGQTSGAHIFSVAQHTLLVEAVMREQTPRVDVRVRLAALLHDAPEYVIGDMISPFKAVLGGDYKAVEKRLLAAIHIRFGLPPVLGTEIEHGRSRMPTGARPISRRRQLAGFAQAEAKRLFGRDPGLPPATRQDYLTPWTAAKAEKRFLARFKTLHP